MTEEFSKGLFLLLLLWWRRAELDGILDGIVYAGMVGIGFAFTENILYLAAAYNGTDGMGPGGTEALTGTFVLRCLFSPFAHPLFTAFTGIGVGIAVGGAVAARCASSPRWSATAARWPRTQPGTARRSTASTSFVVVYLVLMAPAFVALLCVAIWSRRSERAMLTAALERRRPGAG